ncbi:glycosyl hydrolase family 18 protein [Alicyclobacillus fastidiosus]|uniref:chitinase n=1 Tax=Alicyclobacillus fastidiosus TaxID=392011 RepID=A0ABY6ZLW8_9BACL|nr:glycosyl hydrolase family 18 protein [Alicyclobacillus fastidiosus]WAH43477.1 glycosyl hydrolase family 18 protein [Alicyclobacillus fastidiosus]GMA59637.1 hypothetical protein GCM10025859_00770 [Alicyclobacillus fastidiosus]
MTINRGKFAATKALAFGSAAMLGFGVFSHPALADTAGENQQPASPTNVQVSNVTETGATLSWTGTGNGTGDVYEVINDESVAIPGQPNSSSPSILIKTSSTSVQLSNLRPNKTYYLVVKTLDAKGNSSTTSNPVIFTTGNPLERKSKIVGYYANWDTYSGYQVSDIPANELNVINYAFAVIDSDGKIALSDPYADIGQSSSGDSSDANAIKGNFGQLIKLKKRYPNLKTIISVGGWRNSAQFSQVAATQKSRDTFADSVVQFIKKYDFDGVDIDWEYPLQGGSYPNDQHNPNDPQNYTLLLKTIRGKFDTQGALDHKHYYLTIDAAANTTYATKDTNLVAMQKYVDWFNLMTYDIHGSWGSYTGLVAPINTDPADPGKWSDNNAVQLYLKQGVNPDKIVMGVRFFAYEYLGVRDQNNGLYQPYQVGTGTSIPYNKLVTQYLNQKNYSGFTYHWDLSAKSPYLFNGDDFISFEDPASIFMKTEYVDEHNLGGVMIWKLGQDYKGQLLSTIYDNLK